MDGGTTQRRFRKTVLPSGFTVLTETMPERRSASIGVWLRCGARDEPGDALGISHFLEHMMFKGTARRDARAIARALESRGGHLDAFTSREQVCYYARFLSEHIPEAVDVLADILCHSRLDPDDVEREKSVVREEILAYDDSPEEKVNDMLAELLWGSHPLGQPILGTEPSLAAFTPERLREYFRSRYRPELLMLCATGDVEHDRLVELAAAAFDPPDGATLPLSTAPVASPPILRHAVRDHFQLYITLGAPTVADTDPDRYPLVVLNALLGGGMSSRLFQSIREEAGLAYSVYSVPDFFRDTGTLGIQMGVSPERGRDALQRLRAELAQLQGEGPSAEEIEGARAQLRGSLLLEQESVSSRMFQVAHEELYRGRYVSPEEQVRRFESVTDEEVIGAARRYLVPSRFTVAALGPASGEPLGPTDWPTD